MKSGKLLRISATLPLFAVCACQTPIVVNRPAASCGSLIPTGWKDGVPGARLPGLTAELPDWQVFAVNQTAQLDKANGRTADAIGILERCEARDAETVKALTQKPWWRVW